MKEKRNFLADLFGRKDKIINKQTFSLFNGYNATFSNISNNFYDNDVVRACIHTIATHCAKFSPQHIKRTDGQRTNIKGAINYLLNNKPNSIMTTYDFIYKTISMLYLQNNVYIYIDKDDTGFITGFYPINSTSSEFLVDSDDNLYLRFWLINGQKYEIPYSELIHLRRFFNTNDLLGSSNRILREPVEIKEVSEQGIKNAIRTSNSLRGVIKYNTNLKESDIKKNRDNFVNDFLNIENTDGNGIAALDNKGELQMINLEPITLDKDQLEHVDQRILNYFGLNKSILSSDFNADQWNAFFESVLEPLAIYLGQAFTSAIFTTQAINSGNCIEFTVNRVQYASATTKINIVKEAGALGVLTVDMALSILDLPTIGGEEGAKRLQSLNFINSKIADLYQLGDKGDKGDNGGNNDGKKD